MIRNIRLGESIKSLANFDRLAYKENSAKNQDQETEIGEKFDEKENRMIEEKLPDVVSNIEDEYDLKYKSYGSAFFPVLCLTATNCKETETHVVSQFNIRADCIISSPTFIRKNLHISFSKEPTYSKNIIRIFQNKKWKGIKPVIIYCNFKASTEIVANYMKQNGYNAVCYNSDMNEFQRLNILQQFLKQEKEKMSIEEAKRDKLDKILNPSMNFDAIVSTVSLSMGLDHKNVRSVIHYNMPSNIETYIQEIGRSGRDGETALCHCFISDDDYLFSRSRNFVDYL